MTRICDTFRSLQGEGVRTGIPSLFIRSFGCNLCCKGFGQIDPSNESTWVEPEYSLTVSPKYGCDSPNSWHSKFRDLFPDYKTGRELFEKLSKEYKPQDFKEIVITGGEPLLHQDFWMDFLIQLDSIDADIVKEFNVTFETNGSIELSEDFTNFIKEHSWINFLFSISPKLNCVAGVNEKISINYKALKAYLDLWYKGLLNYQLKFVYNGDDRAYNRVLEIISDFDGLIDRSKVLLMPVGGYNVEQDIKIKTAETCIKEGFRYCERVHVDIWGSKMGV